MRARIRVCRLVAMLLAVGMLLSACAESAVVTIIDDDVPTASTPFGSSPSVISTAAGQPTVRAAGPQIDVQSINPSPMFSSTEFDQYCAGVTVKVTSDVALTSVVVNTDYDLVNGKHAPTKMLPQQVSGNSCTFKLENKDFDSTVINFDWQNELGLQNEIVATDASGRTTTRTIYIGHFLGGRDVFMGHATCDTPSTHRQTYYCKTCGRNYQSIVIPYKPGETNYEAATGHIWKEPAETVTETSGAQYTKQICSKCGYIEMTPIDGSEPHEHHLVADPDDSIKATCEEDGYTAMKCDIAGCDYVEMKAARATGHKASAWTVLEEGDCETGKKCIEVQTCEFCHKELNRWEHAADNHEFAWKLEENATCTEGGKRVEKCVHCGKVRAEEELSPTAHDFRTETVEETPATCTAEGKRVTKQVCTVCGYETAAKTETLPKLDHTWSDWASSVAAECGKPGKEERHCEACGETESRDVAALQHVPEADDGDCTTPIKCSLCGVELTPGKAQHSFGLGYKSDENGHWSQCTNPGCEQRKPGSYSKHINRGRSNTACCLPIYCETCGYKLEDAIASQHNFSTEWKTSETKHWHNCTNGECPIHDQEGNHIPTPDDGDCTTPITCSVCGIVLIEGAESHSYEIAPQGLFRAFAKTKVNDKAPYASNQQGHWHSCEHPNCKQATAVEQHTPAPDDGDPYTAVVCTICGYIITPAKLLTPKAPTLTNTDNGIRINWNSVAGATKYRVFYRVGGGGWDGWNEVTDTTATSCTWNAAKPNTKYTFTVRCISTDGKTYTSDFDAAGSSITYILPTPTAPTLVNMTDGIRISWNSVTGAAKYRVFYRVGGGGWDGWNEVTDTTATSCTWNGGKVNTKYTFTVRCISTDGKSYTSDFDSSGSSIVCTGGKLEIPTVRTLSNTDSGIQIRWDRVEGAAKYRVFYRVGGGGWDGWNEVTDTTATSCTWNGGTNGTKYTFTVRTITADGKGYTSDFDAAGSSIVCTAKKLAIPAVTALSNTGSGIRISWNSVAGAAQYRVFYRVGDGGWDGWNEMTDTTATSCTWNGGTNGTKYTFTVRTVTADGKNYTSDFDAVGSSIVCTGGKLATPTVTALSNTGSGIRISWNSVAGAAKYRVFYRVGDGGWDGWNEMTDTTATSCTWTGGTSGTKYTFTVRTITADGKSYTSDFDATGKSITR